MGEYVLRRITMTLDEASIDHAIEEVHRFETQLKPAMQYLIDWLAVKGVRVARAHLLFFINNIPELGDLSTGENINSAHDTGNLYDSIRFESNDGGAKVIAGEGLHNAMGEEESGSYAFYVEYGNGYSRPDGWWYPSPYGWYEASDGQLLAWAPGMEPRPFMGNTLLDLEQEAKVTGGRIIAEYFADHR